MEKILYVTFEFICIIMYLLVCYWHFTKISDEQTTHKRQFIIFIIGVCIIFALYEMAEFINPDNKPKAFLSTN